MSESWVRYPLGAPFQICPGSAIGRGDSFRNYTVWVRVPPRAPILGFHNAYCFCIPTILYVELKG